MASDARSSDLGIPEGMNPNARETWPSPELINSWLGDQDVDFEFRPGEDVAVHDDPEHVAADERGTPQQAAQPRQQHGIAEGLAQVVVGAGGQRRHLVALRVPGGEHQDRGDHVLGPQRPAHLQPGHHREHEVEHHRVVAAGPRQEEAGAAVVRDVDDEAVEPEAPRQHLRQATLVLDQEDAHALNMPHRAGGPAHGVSGPSGSPEHGARVAILSSPRTLAPVERPGRDPGRWLAPAIGLALSALYAAVSLRRHALLRTTGPAAAMADHADDIAAMKSSVDVGVVSVDDVPRDPQVFPEAQGPRP